MTKNFETKYINLLKAERVVYFDKNKIAGLALEGETVSQLEPQASGDNVLTTEDYSSWSTANNVPQAADGVKVSHLFSISAQEDVDCRTVETENKCINKWLK